MSRKRVVLEYDEGSGMVYDAAGMYIGTNLSLAPFDGAEQPGVSFDQMLKAMAVAQDPTLAKKLTGGGE